MTKYWLTGVAAFAMMTGAAFAQGYSTQSQSTTTTVAPAVVPQVNSYSSSETQRTTDGSGSSEKSSSYRAGPGGSDATYSSKVVSPDGSGQTTVHERQTETPFGATTTKQSTTTIDR